MTTMSTAVGVLILNVAASAVITMLIAKFGGRLVDKSETWMKGTSQVSSGGRVEHEIFLWQNVIMIAFEVKHTLGAGMIVLQSDKMPYM
jgi:archaellin